ncbi:chemotaxis protein CheR [Salinirubellus salinus]|uniref:protein-glutamate O-methyltransferase n=1 Tax=Salinirubellus salinus TaxID=1364945 RepID=A0A9E7R0C8_9EURY|nr:chemotaxis protein CheR [Salinirubellus salinus]
MSGSRTESSEADPAFQRLLRDVERDLGFRTSSYNDAYLRRRVEARMRRRGVEGYEAYGRLLDDEADEREALLDALSVNVTSFFRNPEVWAVVREVLREVDGRVRIWSAASSDGREAYSMAMLAFLDPAIDERRVDIVGTDIDRGILRRAREGRYRRSGTDDPVEQLTAVDGATEYVTVTDDAVVVDDRVRDLVTFRRHDLTDGEPAGEFDLVVCRNLFIYIEERAKARMVSTLLAGLAPGGHLVVGLTETLPPDCRDAFEAVDRRRRVYRQRG